MKYQFPVITHIDDVMPAYDPNLFFIAERGDFLIFDYRNVTPETFPDVTDELSAIRREFRGLTFDKNSGEIIRRGYNKFFNINERAETRLENLDLSMPHVILEKLDGSAIFPMVVVPGDAMDQSRIVWGTMMGDTDVGKQAEAFVQDKPEYTTFVQEALLDSMTPIFEWCSDKQRIVLAYPVDQLILTGMRNMITGEYLTYTKLCEVAGIYNIPVVKDITQQVLSEQFLQDTRSSEDAIEGYVVQFENGHRLKMKSDHYCLLHKTKSYITRERYLTDIIAQGKQDDLKPLLDKEDLADFLVFEAGILKHIAEISEDIFLTLADKQITGLTRKDFALNMAPKMHKAVAAVVFMLWDKEHPMKPEIDQEVRNYIVKHTNSNAKYDELRKSSLFDNVPVWRERHLD